LSYRGNSKLSSSYHQVCSIIDNQPSIINLFLADTAKKHHNTGQATCKRIICLLIV